MTAARPLLEVDGLTVGYRARGSAPPVRALRDASLTVAAGETVAVVGESGSGKSTLAHAVLGLLPRAAHVAAGRIALDGTSVLGLPERRWRALRGRQVALVPQDPATALNPVQRIGRQVEEALRAHGLADRRSAGVEALVLLERAGVPAPQLCARQYPHELSGGLRQRVLIAIAIAARPRLIVADEPTSALDVTVQRQILDHLAALTRASGMGMLLITHDLGVAAERADRIVVMSAGAVVEAGRPDAILDAPAHPVTRALVDAAPGRRGARRRGPPPAAVDAPDLLRVDGLVKDFRLPRGTGAAATLRAVDGVGFRIPRGTTFGLVGESGSGKSTVARIVLGLERPDAGRVTLDGTDVTAASGGALRALRRQVQLVHQNPYAALNPRMTVRQLVAEPLASFGVGTRRERAARATALTERVALPGALLGRRPAELSGGQRQRVAIARALALSPALLVCDEPVSALDVSVQAQILTLLSELQSQLGLSLLFISHDLAVVREVAHEVGVMQAGRLVERGPTETVFTQPQHDHTGALLRAIPGRDELASAPA